MGWLKERRFCEQCGEALPDGTPGNVKYCDKHSGLAQSAKRYEERKQGEDPDRRARMQKAYRDRHKDEEDFKERNRNNTAKYTEEHLDAVREKARKNSQDYRDQGKDNPRYANKNDEENLKNYSRYSRARRRGDIPEDEDYDADKKY